MAAARGGLIESRTAVENAAPRGTKNSMVRLMSTFPYPNDVWADVNPPTSPNRPWRILTASDNFRTLMPVSYTHLTLPTNREV